MNTSAISSIQSSKSEVLAIGKNSCFGHPIAGQGTSFILYSVSFCQPNIWSFDLKANSTKSASMSYIYIIQLKTWIEQRNMSYIYPCLLVSQYWGSELVTFLFKWMPSTNLDYTQYWVSFDDEKTSTWNCLLYKFELYNLHESSFNTSSWFHLQFT